MPAIISGCPIRCSLVPRCGMTNAGDNLRVPHPLRSHRKGWDEHCSQATMPLYLPLTVFFTQAKEPSISTEAARALLSSAGEKSAYLPEVFPPSTSFHYAYDQT